MSKIQLMADLHTHTIASGHATSTLTEMVLKAKALGYAVVATTDHAYALQDMAHQYYLGNLLQIPRDDIEGIGMLRGVEVDILDPQASLNIPDSRLAQLDWVIASMHKALLKPMTFEEATGCWLKIAEHPSIDMIGHSEQADFMYDYERVLSAFKANHKVVELNASSVYARPGNEENLKKLALACKKVGVHVAVSSDAHATSQMPKVTAILQLLEEIDFPHQYVINASLQQLKDELIRHDKAIGRALASGEVQF